MERAYDYIDLEFSQVETLCSSCFKVGRLKSFSPLTGGAVNTVYKIVWDDRPYVLRFYVRDPDLAQVEESVYHLIRDKVPVADLVHTGIANNSYPFAIFEFVDKKHIFEISNPALATTLSYDLGRALSCIHNFCFPKAGLFSGNFVIHTPFEEANSPYFAYIMEHFTQGSLAWKRLGDKRGYDLTSFLDRHQDAFPTIHKGGVLVHSDFKPVNLLWDSRDGLTVLDWEFAHIGHSLIDFAILLRHFQDFPFSIESLEKGYHEGGEMLPMDWIQRARITDIINIIQLLNTPAERPQLFKSLIDSVDFTMKKWEVLDKTMRGICI